MSKEEDKLLPIANVGRIMKQILPATAKISKEAKQTMQDCATEFISFVTSEASDKCHKENRKTVNGDDICWALTSLGFDNYGDVIVRYLNKYREFERQKPNNKDKDKVVGVSMKDKVLEEEISKSDDPPLMGFKILEKGSSSSS